MPFLTVTCIVLYEKLFFFFKEAVTVYPNFNTLSDKEKK